MYGEFGNWSLSFQHSAQSRDLFSVMIAMNLSNIGQPIGAGSSEISRARHVDHSIHHPAHFIPTRDAISFSTTQLGERADSSIRSNCAPWLENPASSQRAVIACDMQLAYSV